jgi:DNA polymerase I-like protein with 3'-5' exonuclease and polymerase domains
MEQGILNLARIDTVDTWSPPQSFPDLSGATKIAIDLETRDPDLRSSGPGWPTGNGEVVGVAVATDEFKGYFPIKHMGGGNLDERLVNRWLKDMLALPCDKIFHNAQYDVGWLRAMGHTVNGKIIDTMLVASLLDENRFSYSLNAVAFDYLGKTKSEKGLVQAATEFGLDAKAEMWKMPANFVGGYAEKDAELTLDLWNEFKTKIQREDLTTVFNLETELLPCLIDMTWRGIRVDLEGAERTQKTLIKEEKEVLNEIKRLTNLNVVIWSAHSIETVFKDQQLPYPKTSKGSPSFTREFLSQHDHKIPNLIAKARELNKINGTFINTIQKHAVKGRIHSHINQVRGGEGGTVTGRLSMNNPNLQQIPTYGKGSLTSVRNLFLPEEGNTWASIDFSQQEPRIVVHYAKVYNDWQKNAVQLEGVDDFVSNYQNEPETDFHSLVAEMADIPRKQAKTINLAMMYGMGVKKLSEQLDLSLEEAKDLTKQYHTRVPFVKGLQQALITRLNKQTTDGAYLRSLKGRRLTFDQWEPDTFELTKAYPKREAQEKYGATTRLKRAYTYKCLNKLIQSSAADMTKQAMVNVYKEGIVPLVQVHDELCCSVSSKEQAFHIVEIMEKAIPLEIPSLCDLEMGESWGNTVEI